MGDQVRIKRIRVSNFRSFDLTKRDTPDQDLSGINIFVGPNGGGKSNFFNALRWCMGWDSFNSQGTYDLEHNYRRKDKPIDIRLTLELSGKTKSLTLRCRPGLGRNCWAKRQLSCRNEALRLRVYQRSFPSGIPRQFSEFWEMDSQAKASNYQRILDNWDQIRDDSERFIGITLSKRAPCPPTNDRFFFDVTDYNSGNNTRDIPLLEGSDGQAQFLLLIVKIRNAGSGSVVLIEEPDVNMHPGLQKQFLEYLKLLVKNDGYQFLISTHSPYLMDFATDTNLARKGDVALFRIFKDANSRRSYIDPLKDKSAQWHLLHDLGHSPADVMQPNGIVWVEGPSDVVYLNTWLDRLIPIFAPHHKLMLGVDYSILWYGGSNFAYLALRMPQAHGLPVIKRIWEHRETKRKLLGLFELNPNWAFLVDSDSDKIIPPKTQQNKDAFVRQCVKSGKFAWKVETCIESCAKDLMPEWKRFPNGYPRFQKEREARKYQERLNGLSDTELQDHLNRNEVLSKLNALIDAIVSWRTH